MTCLQELRRSDVVWQTAIRLWGSTHRSPSIPQVHSPLLRLAIEGSDVEMLVVRSQFVEYPFKSISDFLGDRVEFGVVRDADQLFGIDGAYGDDVVGLVDDHVAW